VRVSPSLGFCHHDCLSPYQSCNVLIIDSQSWSDTGIASPLSYCQKSTYYNRQCQGCSNYVSGQSRAICENESETGRRLSSSAIRMTYMTLLVTLVTRLVFICRSWRKACAICGGCKAVPAKRIRMDQIEDCTFHSDL
jgi:hypothetical protein